MSYDLHIEGVPTGEVQGTRCFTFGDYSSPIGIQGIQKLVDRYLKCLCTPKGSDLSSQSYGTAFMGLLTNNLDDRSLKQLTTTSIRDAETQIRKFDVNSDYPDDERLAGVTIEYIRIPQESQMLEVSLILTNVAGTVVKMLVPVIDKLTRP